MHIFIKPFIVVNLFYCLYFSREIEGEEYGRKEVSLSLRDILPINPKAYDKHRAPKFYGQPTVVYFHVTVLSLDSINEESMVHIVDPFLYFFIHFIVVFIINYFGNSIVFP